MDGEFVKWAIACGGWLLAVLLALLGYLERRANQQSELLLKTVAYFEGKTQKRSVGIALVEGLLHKNPKHRDVLVPLLTNQFVYLLLHPDVAASVHEERNLIRLYNLLTDTPNLKQTHYHSWCEIADAIGRRSGGECSGITITEPTLNQWRKNLGIPKEE